MKMLIVGGVVRTQLERLSMWRLHVLPHPHRLSFLVSSGWSVRLEKSGVLVSHDKSLLFGL